MATRKFGGRTLARSQALQLLFQAEATGQTVTDVLCGPYALSQGPLDEFGERLARGAGEIEDLLDVMISSVSRNWSVTRMPSVDRNLLRLALYEMLEVDEVAIAVTIDESVELAKAYGTDESARFVNGVLGRLATRIEEGEDLIATATAQLAAEKAERAAEEAARAAEAAAREADERDPAASVAARDAYEAEDEDGLEGAETTMDEAAEDPAALGRTGA